MQIAQAELAGTVVALEDSEADDILLRIDTGDETLADTYGQQALQRQQQNAARARSPAV